MDLGNFSISLAARDLAASRAFHAAQGFAPMGGAASERWMILKNGACTPGRFERNMSTFNPGQDAEGRTVDGFTDVREIQRRPVAAGLSPTANPRRKRSGGGPLHVHRSRRQPGANRPHV